MKIDCHLHLTKKTTTESYRQVIERLIKEMDSCGIDKAIVIPDNATNPVCADLEEVNYYTQNNDRLLMVASLLVEKAETHIRLIDDLFAAKRIHGFKIFPGHDPVYPNDHRWFPIYNLCVKYDKPLIIHTGINSNNRPVAKYNEPTIIAELAKLMPNLNIVIAHYNWPDLDHCFKSTNGLNNIYFDTSALADDEVIEESGGLDNIRHVLEKTMQRNPHSVLFGTDWPICDIKKHVDLINSLSISETDKNNIFSQNILNVFHL